MTNSIVNSRQPYGESGVVVIETILSLVVLLLIALWTIEMGVLAIRRVRLTEAVRDATRIASTLDNLKANDPRVVTEVVLRTNYPGLVVTNTERNANPIIKNSQGYTCNYAVTVTATFPYTFFAARIIGINSTVTLRRNWTMRYAEQPLCT